MNRSPRLFGRPVIALRGLVGALLVTGCVLAGCNSSTTPAQVIVKPKPGGLGAAFRVRFTDHNGIERTASPADIVSIKVNGVALHTTVTGAGETAAVQLPSGIDAKSSVEVANANGNKLAFRVSDVQPAADKSPDPNADAATVWMMPWKKGEFMGQVGPFTKPMTSIKSRATRVPLAGLFTDAALTDDQLKRVYVGRYRLPRHLAIVDDKGLALDPSFAFYLQAAKDDKSQASETPPLRLLFGEGSGLKALTIAIKKYADDVPALGSDGLPTFRTEEADESQADLGASHVDAVPDVLKFEQDVVKVDEDFFPTMVKE